MEIRIISSNIRFDNPADGVNAWDKRRHILNKTLLRHDPWIIATQEGRFHQLNELQELLIDYEMVDQHRSWISERMYPTFFIKKGKFEYLQSGDSWLSETPHIAGSRSFESAFPRLMTWTSLQIKNSTDKFLIVNTHLDHIKSETRIQQVKVLSAEILKVWEKTSHLILMGDFNDGPQSEVRKVIMTQFKLQDTWALYNAVEESSHHGFKGAIENGSRIDWILTDEKLKISSCVMDKNCENGFYPSDHFPIVCTLSL